MITDWNWFGYAAYFFDYRGHRLSLMGDAADKPRKVQLIKDSIVEASRKGGHVYMRDLKASSPGELAFVESLTGFTPADFNAFKQHQAFSCSESKFVTIVQAK